MYKFIPIICLTILVAACAGPISQVAKDELAQPVNCATAEEDIRILKQEKASAAEMTKEGVTALIPVGAVIGIITFTEDEKLEVASGVYNKKIDEKIAEIKRECGIVSALDEGEEAQAIFDALDVNHDGTIAREELMVIYPDTVFVAEKFTTFDKDSDGDIEIEEFVEVY